MYCKCDNVLIKQYFVVWVFVCAPGYLSNYQDFVKAQEVKDELCLSNQFVRTVNQTNKELFTTVGIGKQLFWTMTLNRDVCYISVKNCEAPACNISSENANENKHCQNISITSCHCNEQNQLVATLEGKLTINNYYNGTEIFPWSNPGTVTRLEVLYCRLNFTNQYTMVNQSAVSYGDVVEVRCINGSQLVLENSLSSSNNLTLTCDECGLWESYEEFHCVIVLFTGNLSYVENSTAYFKCTVNEPMFSSGMSLKYLLDGNDITDEIDSKIITASDHMSTIQCTVIFTSGSQIFSQRKHLDVKYKPFNITTKTLPNKLYRSTTNGVLLNDSQSVNLSCSADANPAVDCIWNNISANINNSCDVISYFDTSSTIYCNVYNNLGSLTSLATNITLVGARNAELNGVPNKIVEGDVLKLFCNLPFSNELNTSFNWIVPNTVNTVGLESSQLQITSTDKTHNGFYKCKTSDEFGNYSTQAYINVLYKPYDVSIIPILSDVIQKTGSNLFLNSTQNVLLNCTSNANPAANCTFQIDDTTDISDSLCVLEKEFNQSANVTCTASNEIDNITSHTLKVTVVQPRNEVDSDLSPTNNKPIEEEDLVLDCSIPYQEELNTTFSWKIPSERDLDKTSWKLQINNLTRFDLGNYTCTTMDVFGQSLRTTFLNVNYSPQKVGGQTTCHWSDVINGSCHVIFTSNPKSEHFVIKQQDKIEPCPKCSFQSSHDDIYTQQFTLLLENAPEQTTFYQVHILSQNSLLQNLTVELEVTVGDVINQTGLIVGCVVGGIVLIVLVVGIILYYNRRKGNKTIKETNISSQNGVIDTTDNYSTVELGNQVDSPKKTKKEKKKKTKAPKTAKSLKADVLAAVGLSKKQTKDNEKEERLNPLFDGVDIPDQITDAYDTVDVNKTQNEKEDRLNPLYGVGKENGFEEAYASVDKTKKKKKEKVGAVSGIQDAYAEVDFDKKKKNKKNKKSKKAHVPSNEKEEKAEESQDAYATVDISKKKKKESSEKEDRLNPLYDMGQGNGIEDAYASVDKSAKRDTSEKEDRINPLYDSYQDQPSTSGSGNLDSLHASYSTTGMTDTYAVVDKQNGPSKKKKAPIKPPVKKKPDIKPPTPTKPGALKPPKPKKPDIKKKPDLNKKEDD